MDRVRVLCPSISVAAHAAGAALLAVAPLFLPAAPPLPSGVFFARPLPTAPFSVGVGGGPRGSAPRAPRPVSRESRLVPPGLVALLVPETEIDLGNGASIPGLPDGGPGGGGGSCLFGCDVPVGAALPAAEAQVPDAPHPHSLLRVGGHVREPRKVRHVAPAYPPLAVAARIQGSVTLECVIGEDGQVSEITIVRGHPLLDAAAADAVRQWRYTPTLLNGVRVSVILTVVVDFRLR